MDSLNITMQKRHSNARFRYEEIVAYLYKNGTASLEEAVAILAACDHFTSLECIPATSTVKYGLLLTTGVEELRKPGTIL